MDSSGKFSYSLRRYPVVRVLSVFFVILYLIYLHIRSYRDRFMLPGRETFLEVQSSASSASAFFFLPGFFSSASGAASSAPSISP